MLKTISLGKIIFWMDNKNKTKSQTQLKIIPSGNFFFTCSSNKKPVGVNPPSVWGVWGWAGVGVWGGVGGGAEILGIYLI